MSDNFETAVEPTETIPDIFRAAQNNDVSELLAALAVGQSLSDRDGFYLNQTPVHFAARLSSNDFLAVAASHETFNPWLRDDNERTAFDHADAHRNERGKSLLFKAMYGAQSEPDYQHIDYTDNERSEFFP